MPQSYIEYSSGLTATTFSVPFKYLNIDNVNAIGTDGTNWTPLTIASRSASANTITLASAPSAFQAIRVYRQSAVTQLVDFQAGARLTESELDTAYNQGLFVAQEVSEDANKNQYTNFNEAALLANTSLSAFHSSTHTGDNSTVTFGLSFTPQTTIPQGYLVIVDGVLQSPVDAYTISIAPAQITFTSAPPTSAKIVVTTTAAATGTLVEDTDLRASVSISTTPPAIPKAGELWFDSSIMTMFAYYDDGDGSPQWVSISSSVASSNNKVKTLKDFGAVGDGVTNDTTAIQAALDAASGNTQHILDGEGLTYRIFSTLRFNKARITLQNFKFIADASWVSGTINYTDMGSASGGESGKIPNRGNPMIRMWRDDTGLTGGEFKDPKLLHFELDCNDVAPGICAVETRQARIGDGVIIRQKGYGLAMLVKNTEGHVYRLRIHEDVWNGTKMSDSTGNSYNSAGYVQTCADIHVVGLVSHYSQYPMWLDGFFNAQFTSCHPYNGSYPNPSNNPNIYIGAGCNNTVWTNTYVDNGFIEMHSFNHKFIGGNFANTSSSTNEFIAKLVAPSGGVILDGLNIQGFNNANKVITLDETAGNFTNVINSFIPYSGTNAHSAHKKSKLFIIQTSDWVADGSNFTYEMDITGSRCFTNSPLQVDVSLRDQRTAAGRSPISFDYSHDVYNASGTQNKVILRSNVAAACTVFLKINEGFLGI